MSIGRLTDLQERALRLLSSVEPPWTLTGGAALAGFHTAHRETRDLDLFWLGRASLDALPAAVADALRRDGLVVHDLQASPAFHRLQVSDGREALVVDLVADRAERAEPPTECLVGGVKVRVETPYQILVNKLTTLLSRAELRDLDDVRVLVGAGGDLAKALADAPRVDGGFSPLTLAWVLETLPLRLLASRQGRQPEEVEALEHFRRDLIERLTRAATPDEP